MRRCLWPLAGSNASMRSAQASASWGSKQAGDTLADFAKTGQVAGDYRYAERQCLGIGNRSLPPARASASRGHRPSATRVPASSQSSRMRMRPSPCPMRPVRSGNPLIPIPSGRRSPGAGSPLPDGHEAAARRAAAAGGSCDSRSCRRRGNSRHSRSPGRRPASDPLRPAGPPRPAVRGGDAGRRVMVQGRAPTA